MKQATIPHPWGDLKPKHQWRIENDRTAHCDNCNLAIRVTKPITREPFPCIVIHLAKRLSQAKRARSNPEAACGYTKEWHDKHSLVFQGMHCENTPVVLPELESTVSQTEHVMPPAQAVTRTITMRVNCPDCLHPGNRAGRAMPPGRKNEEP